MSKEIIRIEYPKTAAGKKQWAKLYGSNAYWSGKHHAQRAEDARYWHALTLAAMNRAKIRKTAFEKPVVVTFQWNDGLDLDNHAMMAKMILDALKKRLIWDDTRKWVRGIEHYWHNDSCITVTVREVDDG